jgi:8-oxo-dGTP pyrophosphatase MutT (NUDIX family)
MYARFDDVPVSDPSKRIPATIRARLGEALAARTVKTLRAPGTPASVLALLVDHGGDAHLWLCVRPSGMRRHGGQVALPGGKRDDADPSALDAALRETEEELGFPRARISVQGRLDDVITTTGFVVSPFVGWLDGDLAPNPNPLEIHRAFLAPLAPFVFERPRPQFFRGSGITRIAPSWLVEGEIVWGATARILGRLADVVRTIL